MKRAWTLAATVGLAATLGTVAWAAVGSSHHDVSTWSRLAPLAWNIGNFAILVYILYRFGWGKISAYLRERQENTQSNLELAEKARDMACERARIYREKLEAVGEEIQRIIAEVKEEGEAEKNRIIESARQAVEQIKKEARRATEEELNRSAALLREEMVSLSTQIAEGILHRNLTPEDQRRLIRHYLDQMAELS